MHAAWGWKRFGQNSARKNSILIETKYVSSHVCWYEYFVRMIRPEKCLKTCRHCVVFVSFMNFIEIFRNPLQTSFRQHNKVKLDSVHNVVLHYYFKATNWVIHLRNTNLCYSPQMLTRGAREVLGITQHKMFGFWLFKNTIFSICIYASVYKNIYISVYNACMVLSYRDIHEVQSLQDSLVKMPS